MDEHRVNSFEVFFTLVVQFLGLALELLEASFGVDEDIIFGMLPNVELGLELLRCLLWRLGGMFSRPGFRGNHN